MLNDFLVFLCIWVFCGLIAYGAMFADCIANHPGGDDSVCIKIRWIAFVLGPVGLFAATIVTKFFQHGLRFK